MKHLTDEQLSAYMDGAFKGRDAEEAGRHLADCQPCREALAELAERDATLKPALMHDPGAEYFEGFAARVEDRIRTAATSPARGAGFDPGRWFRSPRALAWAGAAAVVIVGGGVALMTSREVIVPMPWDRERAAKLEHAAPAVTKPAEPPAPQASGQEEIVVPPSPGAAVEETPLATTERERATAPSLAKSRADAPAPETRPASPKGAVEVRRNEMGEEVPVRRLGAPTPTPAPARGVDEISRVRKKLAAEPMDAAKRAASRQTLGATGAREESAAREYSFAPPPPVQSPLAPRAQQAPDLESEPRLCGDVRDAADRPVAGAQVALSDLGRTTTTDATGHFCMRAPRGEHALSVMAVGYRESRQVVRVAGAEADARVTLAAVAVLDPKGGSFARRAATDLSADVMNQAKDAYASLPDTVRGMVREARHLEAEAAALGSADHFESAASAWGRVLPRVGRGRLETETRRHVAETRFRAWETGPNASRARAALQALNAYVARAPAGPERDQAIRWRDRVRP